MEESEDFLDSDDFLSPNAVQTSCDAADELGADVLEFGVEIVKNSDNPPSEIAWNWLERYYSQEKPLPEMVFGSRLINACFNELVIPWNVWNKLYHADVLRAALREYRGERVNMFEDMLITMMVLCHTKHYARINAKLYTYIVGGGMSTTSAHGLRSDDLNRRGNEWLALKLAREWLDKIAYPLNQITPSIEALARHVQEDIYSILTERYAPDTRMEYLKRLAQSCTQEEFADLLCMCIDRQQARIRQPEAQNWTRRDQSALYAANLYFDYGEGYKQENSVSIAYDASRFVDFTALIPNGTASVRLDMVEDCYCVIKNLEIIYDHGALP